MAPDLHRLDLLPTLACQHLPPVTPWPMLDNPAALQALADQCLDGVVQHFSGAEQVTDKRPDNFLNTGLFKTLFPDARIVFTRRAPQDNCLSVWRMRSGRNMPCALDLVDTAHGYQQHLRLVQHWPHTRWAAARRLRTWGRSGRRWC